MLWCLFFLICFGLGYPTLNRYDPRGAGNPDSAQYYLLVTSGVQEAEGYWKYRVLVPYLAKPVYWVVRGRLGTWDPVFFALLVVNSAFAATAAWLLVRLGERAVGDPGVALLGASLYLLNFTMPNLHLAGLVDTGEACLLMITTWAMWTERWFLLPGLGVVGALAKETFILLSAAFILAWLFATIRDRPLRWPCVAWAATMALTGLATVAALHVAVSGRLVLPWTIQVRASDGPFLSLNGGLFWHVFVWLLPLGVIRLARLPRPWVFGSVAAGVAALGLGVWAGGIVARPIFNAVGPVLSLSTACLLRRWSLRES